MNDTAEMGQVAAARIAHAIAGRPSPVLGVATGASPIAVYDELSLQAKRGTIDFSAARGFALDEYVGLRPDDVRSYAYFVRHRIEEPLGMAAGAIRVPDGMAVDLDRAADDFDAAVTNAGGVDVQLLGIGTNGHIGFNEPSSSLASRTRVKTLSAGTRHDNARFFADAADVPALCLTQGLGTISEARQVVLVAAGAGKARAIAAMAEGPVTSMCPGSVLQLHPHTTIVVDEAAAGELALRDYYRAASGDVVRERFYVEWPGRRGGPVRRAILR